MIHHTKSGATTTAPPAPIGDRRWVRAPVHDRRIRRGDDFAGDAWRHAPTGDIRRVAVGLDPTAAANARASREPMGTGAAAAETRRD